MSGADNGEPVAEKKVIYIGNRAGRGVFHRNHAEIRFIPVYGGEYILKYRIKRGLTAGVKPHGRLMGKAASHAGTGHNRFFFRKYRLAGGLNLAAKLLSRV